MSYRVVIKPEAEKELKRVPKAFRSRILAGLAKIRLNPYIGKGLEGKYRGYYSVRIWPYRVVYFIYKKGRVLIILRIRHRQEAYKK